MSNRLVIGVLRPEPGWRLVLEQLGVSFEAIRSPAVLDATRQSAVIVNAPAGREEMEALTDYVRRGGAILDTGPFLPIANRNTLRRRPGTVDEAIVSRPGVDNGPDSSTANTVGRGTGGRLSARIHRMEWKGGAVAFLPIDAGRAILSTRSARRPFPASSRRPPTEVVSRVDKGEIRRAIGDALRWLHASRGLPYVHTPTVPPKTRGVFGFRVDTDYGTRGEIVALRAALHGAGAATTWFIHVEAHAGWLDLFGEFSGDEIALHCMRHRTFRGYEENRTNLSAGLAALRAAGFEPTGVAAPNGRWNVGLARATEDLDFAFASEFSLGYDDLPFHPWLASRFSTVLQVPVHPICLGSFIRAKGNDDDVRSYFSDVVVRGGARREPVFLYGHPGHGRWDLLADEVEHALALGLTPMTMGAFAAWWRRRADVAHEATIDASRLSVHWKTGCERVGLELERVGEYCVIQGGSAEVDLDLLTWSQPLCEAPPVISVPRKPMLAWRQNLEDFNVRMGQ